MLIKSTDLIALLPFFVALVAATVVILVDVFHRTDKPRAYVAHIATAGMVLTLASVWYMHGNVEAGPAFGKLIYHDGFSTFLNALFVLAAILTIMVSPRYLREHGAERGEYYALIILATTGMMLMAAAGDLLMVFLGLEIMSIAIYVLVGFFRADGKSAEAATKYFFLGAFASAIFLYGMALIYGTTGGTSLEGIAAAVRASASSGDNVLVHMTDDVNATSTLDPLFYIGCLMLLVGMAFKVALVPFHMWTPDAYTGAPSSTVGFMATAVKAAAFAALIRLLFIGLGVEATRIDSQGWVKMLFYLSIITIIVGNLMAIVQTNVKRMLAYSSIAHAGYATIGLVASGYTGAGAGISGYAGASSVLFYLLTYTFATLGAFGVLSYLGNRHREVTTFDDLSGLGYKYPAIGFILVVFMLSSAGIPPTAGFVGKFHVFRTAIVAGEISGDNSFIWLVAIAFMASVAGAYYYLRVVVHLYMKESNGEVPVLRSKLTGFALAISAFFTLLIGVYPTPFIEIASDAMKDFQGVEVAYGPQGETRAAGLNVLPEEDAAKVEANTIRIDPIVAPMPDQAPESHDGHGH